MGTCPPPTSPSPFLCKYLYVSISLLLEECIEEGEIVYESSVLLVLSVVEKLLSEILSRLHAAACTPHLTPGGGGAGAGLELAVGMQEGLEGWCQRLLELFQQEERDYIW